MIANSTDLPLKIELIKRIRWLVKLRWIAITGVLLTVSIASWGLHIIDNPTPLYIIAALMTLYNFEPQIYPKHLTEKPLVSIQRHAGRHIILDLFSLTALLHFSGGVENPFIFYFIFHLVIASILLSKKVSYILATLNTILLSALIFLEYYHVLPHYHLQNFLPVTLWRNPIYISSVLFVFTSTLFFSVYLATSIMDTARAREAETRELKDNLEEKVVELEETRGAVLFERNKLTSIIECMQEGVIFVDDKNHVSLFNKAGQQIQKEQFGLDTEALQSPEADGVLLQIAEDLSKGHAVIEQQSLQIKDKFFENTYAAVRDRDENYLGTVLVCRDVTDREADGAADGPIREDGGDRRVGVRSCT